MFHQHHDDKSNELFQKGPACPQRIGHDQKIVPHYIPHSGVCQFAVFKQKYDHSDSVTHANFALATIIER